MHKLLSSAPLLIPTACFVVGILCGFSNWPLIWMAVLLVPVIILLLLRHIAWAAWLLCFMIGWCDATIQTPGKLDSRIYNYKQLYSGVVTKVSEQPAKNAVTLDIDVDSIGHKSIKPRKVSLTILSPDDELYNVSQRIKWVGKLSPVKKPDIAEMNDFSRELRRRGITERCIVRSSNIKGIYNQPGIINDLKRTREKLSHLILESNISSESIELLNAVILGDTSWLNSQNRKSFASAGLSHILALSGMHVAIIAMLVTAILWPLYLVRAKRYVLPIMVIILWIYAIVTGLSPSVVRAVIMASVFSVSRILQRKASPLNSLALSALAILVISPISLFSYSFQLSFAAVLGIIIFATKLNPISPRRRFWHNVLSYISVSVAAFLGTGVLSILYFHTFPSYFILTSFVAAILLPFICIEGVAIMIFSSMGISIEWLNRLTDISVNLLNDFVNSISLLPFHSIENIYISTPVLILSIVTIFFFAVTIHAKRRIAWFYATVMTLTATIIAQILAPPYVYHPKMIKILPYKNNTVVLLRDGDKIQLWISSMLKDTLTVRDRFMTDFSEYLNRSNVRNVSVAQSDSMSFIGLKMFLPDKDSDISRNAQYDYVILNERLNKKCIKGLIIAPSVRYIISPAVKRKNRQLINETFGDANISELLQIYPSTYEYK